MIHTMDDINLLWQACLEDIETQVTKANFSTWFKNTHIQKIEDGVVFIGVPNEFVKEWMLTKYQKMILKAIVDRADYVRAIEFTISKITPQTQEKKSFGVEQNPPQLPISDIYINRDDNLNPRYTFDKFIVGSFNELAYAAAQAIVKRPQQAYNPLFIYGGSGLGKTHLIQAVGNEIKKVFPEKKVLYTSLEKFSIDFVSSVQNNRQQAFRDKYRKYDVMIIDDIQFIIHLKI